MNKEPLVSVCIGIYNRGAYLDETLKSIVEQKYKNLEIVLCDNASEDNSVQVAENWMSKDKRIVLYKNKKNLGPYENANMLVGYARSNYLALFHSDDIYDQNIIQEEMKVIHENEDINIVFAMANALKKNRKTSLKIRDIYRLKYCPSGRYYYGDYKLVLDTIITNGRNIFMCPSMMVKKYALIKLMPFREEYGSCDDLYNTMRILRNGGNVAIVDKPLFTYRLHSLQHSAIQNKKEMGKIKTHYLMLKDLLFSEESNVSSVKKKINRILAIGYLYAAAEARYCKNGALYFKNRILSKRNFKFTVFSKYGLIQRFPMIFNIIKLIKNKIEIVFK